MQPNYAKFMQILQYLSIIKRCLCLNKRNTNYLSTVQIIMTTKQERRNERGLKNTMTILLNTRALYLVFISFILKEHFLKLRLIKTNDYGYCFP